MKFIKVLEFRIEKGAKPNVAVIQAPCQMGAKEKIYLSALQDYFFKMKPVSRAVVSQLDLSILSVFQKEVLLETLKIPLGQTKTYGELSDLLKKRGVKAAPRAVGQALKRNPYPVLIPCHRVVGKSDLGGYSGKNQNWKAWLLNREGVTF